MVLAWCCHLSRYHLWIEPAVHDLEEGSKNGQTVEKNLLVLLYTRPSHGNFDAETDANEGREPSAADVDHG